MTFNTGHLPPRSSYRRESVRHDVREQREHNHSMGYSNLGNLFSPPSSSTTYRTHSYNYPARSNVTFYPVSTPQYVSASCSYPTRVHVSGSTMLLSSPISLKVSGILLAITGAALACLGIVAVSPELLLLGLASAAIGGLFYALS